MLTKEQCLSDKWNPQSSAIDLDNPHLRDAIFYGMQLFAKDVAIAFAIYLDSRDIVKLKNGKWNSIHTETFADKTDEEIFKEFLQSIN